MVYGRLDVFFPDGMLKPFQLSAENISLGRSAGNTIALDTDTISRYHLSITRKDNETYITDLESVNGTFVDGVRLPTNVPTVLRGGEEILIGELIMIYQDANENPTRPLDVPEEMTRRITPVESRTSFNVEAEAPDIAIAPGAYTSSRIMITNASSETTRFVVEVSGIPREWIRVDRPELEVRSGDSEDVTISFKPTRVPESTPGDYRVRVLVRPKNQLDEYIKTEVPLKVLPYSGLGVALETRQVRAGDQFRLLMHNQGNAPLQLKLYGRDLTAKTKTPGKTDGLVKFDISSTQIVLGAGQRASFSGTVAMRQPRLFGEPRTIPFDVLIRAANASGFLVAVRGRVTEKPALPKAALYAVSGLLAAAAVLLIVLAALLLRPAPRPAEIINVTAPPAVIQGTPASLSWSALYATSVVLNIAGTPVATVLPGQNGVILDTTGLDGSVPVEVIAAGGGGTAVASFSIQVDTPLLVSSFSAQPDAVLLYADQQITVTWSVPGAQSVRLFSGDIFSGTEDLPAQGSATARMTLLQPGLTIQLLATGMDGETTQAALTIDTTEPLCAPRADAQVFDAPGQTAQVIATFPALTSFIVEARTADGEWLRAPVTGGLKGWVQRALVDCQPPLDPMMLQVDGAAPTPPVPATPTPTASPSPTPSPTTPSPTRTMTPTQTAGFSGTATAIANQQATIRAQLTQTASAAPPRPNALSSDAKPTVTPSG
jgi:hypothetical protein